MVKRNKIGGRIALAFLIGMVLAAAYEGYQLYHHFAFTTGTVTRITKPGWRNSGDYSIIFEYSVNGNVYRGNNNYDYCHGQSMEQLKSIFVGKRFPVVYAINTPSTGFMLLHQKYADKYKYVLPDSVKYYDSLLTCE